MDFLSTSILHKLFIVFYSFLIIYGFYFDFKEKNKMEKRIKDKIDKEFKTEIVLEVDEEEKYMLRSLAYEYGYNNVEEFMVSILNNEINDDEEEWIIY